MIPMLAAVNWLDYAVIALYLLGVVGAGCYSGFRKRKGDAAQGYFLAGKTLRWPSIGMALFATNISSVHLVSLAQAGYDDGLLMGNFEWMAAYTLILLGLFFAPFYIRSRVATLPDFLEKRYCRQCRDWLAVVSVVAAIVVHIGFALLTGAIVMKGIFGFDEWTCIIALTALTALYTIIGGLGAVVLTETIQTIVLIGGAVLISAFAYVKVGGWDAIVAHLQATKDTVKISMLRTDGDMRWYAILLGYPVLGIWYWCADQTIVQRVLGAKDENHARTGPLFCALIKILPVFIFVLPGLMFYVIIRTGGLPGVLVSDSKDVYGLMIQNLLPSGLFGIVAAALMAALMSTIASAANSISTLVSYDLFKRLRPQTGGKSLVLIGRIAASAAFIVGIALVPLLGSYESIFKGVNDIIAHIAPPITTVFLVGIFWPAASATSARWTMWIGSLLGALVYALRKLAAWKPDDFAWVPKLITEPSFMMMAFWLFVACVAMQVALTLLFPKHPAEDPERLYWQHPLDAIQSPGWPGLANYRVLAAAVFIIMTTLYVVFR